MVCGVVDFLDRSAPSRDIWRTSLLDRVCRVEDVVIMQKVGSTNEAVKGLNGRVHDATAIDKVLWWRLLQCNNTGSNDDGPLLRSPIAKIKLVPRKAAKVALISASLPPLRQFYNFTSGVRIQK